MCCLHDVCERESVRVISQCRAVNINSYASSDNYSYASSCTSVKFKNTVVNLQEWGHLWCNLQLLCKSFSLLPDHPTTLTQPVLTAAAQALFPRVINVLCYWSKKIKSSGGGMLWNWSSVWWLWAAIGRLAHNKKKVSELTQNNSIVPCQSTLEQKQQPPTC